MAAATMASTSRNMALGSVRFRFAGVVICARKVSHIRGPRDRWQAALTAEDEPEEFAVEEEDEPSHGPSNDLRNRRVHQRAHLRAVASKLNQRDDGKGQLKAENHLAQHDHS